MKISASFFLLTLFEDTESVYAIRMSTRKFCLYCGGSLIVHEGQHLRCTQCHAIHFHNPVPATAAIIVQDGKLLYVRRAREPRKGCWDFAGGFLDNGENGEEGIIRECREELGVEIKILNMLGTSSDVYMYADDNTKVLNLYYHCEIIRGELQPADDVDGFAWFPIEDTPENIAFKHMLEALPGIRKKLG